MRIIHLIPQYNLINKSLIPLLSSKFLLIHGVNPKSMTCGAVRFSPNGGYRGLRSIMNGFGEIIEVSSGSIINRDLFEE